MNSAPILNAALHAAPEGEPRVQGYAAPNASLVLAGHGLPHRWRRCRQFAILDTGFGFGLGFLAAWQGWREDAARCERLVYIAIEPRPLTRVDLMAALERLQAPVHLARSLGEAWPPSTHNLHQVEFESGAVRLLLAFGEVRDWLPELVAELDAIHVPTPIDPRAAKALGRLARPETTLSAAGAEPRLRAALRRAGFVLAPAPEATLLATYAPAFTPRRAPARAGNPPTALHAVIVGAGLAGCAAASALGRQGWRSTVLERDGRLANEASGNPAGLFHGIVNAQDGIHARFNRAAALRVSPFVNAALASGVPGAANGLLRLESDRDVAEMRALLARLALPPEYLQALTVAEASQRAGFELALPCWWYPTGGWIAPRGLAAEYLRHAGSRAELRTDVEVGSLERIPGGWRLLDGQGDFIAESETVVLANAGQALSLLGNPAWPIETVRGQVSLASKPGFALPRHPVAGSGYLLPPLGGMAMFGATSQADDLDPSVRIADHQSNIAQLERLLGRPSGLVATDLAGRTAWRCTAADRLPVIGAVPDPDARPTRLDQPRFVPRLPGLYVLSGLGSRGITWSALAGEILAAWVSGAPSPVEASLLDAVDPARFVSRIARSPGS